MVCTFYETLPRTNPRVLLGLKLPIRRLWICFLITTKRLRSDGILRQIILAAQQQVGKKDQRQIGQMASAEIGELVTHVIWLFLQNMEIKRRRFSYFPVNIFKTTL